VSIGDGVDRSRPGRAGLCGAGCADSDTLDRTNEALLTHPWVAD